MKLRRRIPERLILLVGSIGPLGHLPASGSVTVAIVGIPIYWACSGLTPSVYLLAAAAFTIAAICIHQMGDRILRQKDSPVLVWDGLVGFFIAVYGLPFSPPLAAIAFFVERVIDIGKVPPAKWIERTWPGGLGVVGDDVIAGIYTCAMMHGLLFLAPGLVK